jgi:hypothetical protein
VTCFRRGHVMSIVALAKELSSRASFPAELNGCCFKPELRGAQDSSSVKHSAEQAAATITLRLYTRYFNGGAKAVRGFESILLEIASTTVNKASTLQHGPSECYC